MLFYKVSKYYNGMDVRWNVHWTLSAIVTSHTEGDIYAIYTHTKNCTLITETRTSMITEKRIYLAESLLH